MLFFQITFITICLNSLLNIYADKDESMAGGVGLVLGIVFFSLCVLYMAFFALFIFRNHANKNLENEDFKSKFLSLVDGLNTSTKWSACANLAWIIRGFILVIIVFAL
jgi:hypothetical protein